MEKEGRRSIVSQRTPLYCELFAVFAAEVFKISNENLQFGVLIYCRFQIVRPGGMERPTDSYKETHNTTLSQEDTLFGGQVSNLQVFFLLVLLSMQKCFTLSIDFKILLKK